MASVKIGAVHISGCQSIYRAVRACIGLSKYVSGARHVSGCQSMYGTVKVYIRLPEHVGGTKESKKSLATTRTQRVSLMLPSRIFIAVTLKLKSMVHFEFITMYIVYDR